MLMDAVYMQSAFYSTLAPYTKKGALPAVFSSRDEEVHRWLRSPIASLYSMSKVLPLESFINATIEAMSAQLDARFVDSQAPFDLAHWLQYFAFDVMGTLTFSKRYGFLEMGVDVGGMLGTIWGFMRGAAPVCLCSLFCLLSMSGMCEANGCCGSLRKSPGSTRSGTRMPL
jgi:hypothetical protein